ncbi:hypothetical protein PP744_gp021 [Rhizobium phage RHph_N38]|uniref:Uncharacterized protein n=1 Tax=Rhizobium phage RHph_N38 TaxID=2509750 RepID=A0A7S5REB3_9CAUD|nr:hypothetical protein PP744_gp021 [Rhizobium phage RHph_N38]QIG70484.1 hypothetical protein EVB89_021 [Rhizobium phage RHph_N38]
MSVKLYMKEGNVPVTVGWTYTTTKHETFTVKEILPPSFRLGGAAVLATNGKIYLPSEYGAYCVTEDD